MFHRILLRAGWVGWIGKVLCWFGSHTVTHEASGCDARVPYAYCNRCGTHIVLSKARRNPWITVDSRRDFDPPSGEGCKIGW